MIRNRKKQLISAVLSIVVLGSVVASAFAADIVRDRYFSTFSPAIFNNSGAVPAVGSTTSLMQYRLNCYGYAIQTHYYGTVTVQSYGGYKQQPGSFASASNQSLVKTNIISNQPASSMSNIVYNMNLDASRIGYTVSEYIVPSSGVVAQAPAGQRMIALVTGNYDYHYYMQNSNGNWSHKPGSTAASDKSITDGVLLTNSNIKAKANQGAYAGGALKFFLITKDAVADYPHGPANTSTREIPLYYKDKAGEYPVTSTTIGLGTTQANIDFDIDRDTYCFTPSISGTYQFTTSNTSGADLDGYLYDAAGVRLTYDTSTSPVSISYSLTAGRPYYIQIYNYTKTLIPYSITVQKI